MQKDWRDIIIEKLIPETKRSYLFFDPDFLFKDEVLNIRIQEKGFDTLIYENDIEFRINYEQKVRFYTDQGLLKEIIILIHDDLSTAVIPFDIAEKSDSTTYDYALLFPHLDRRLIRELPVEMLDELYTGISDINGDLTYHDSCTYVLRTLFAIDTDLINNDVQLLRFLLHLHYDRPQIPRHLLNYILDELKSNNRFPSWDLEKLIFDGSSFFRFVSERMKRTKPTDKTYEIEGPSDLPFSRKEIRVYLDNLIEEGYIEGFSAMPVKPRREVVAERLENLKNTAPESFEDWLSFAHLWAKTAAELYLRFHPETDEELFKQFHTIKKERNTDFASWLLRSYGSLYNFPPSSPSMVHHIPRYLSQSVFNRKKVALVIIDGLAYSQWKVLNSTIQTHRYRIRERSLFAWIPTVTTVSRQALLSGKIPLSIESFLRSTHREEKLWKIFWEDNGVESEKVFYGKLSGDKDELDTLDEKLAGGPAVAAIIIGKVDSIAHGQMQGSAMMHKEIAHWAETSFFDIILSRLFDYFDEIYITSDHGNDEAQGIGSISQGVLVQEKGLRCRIYNEQHFLDEALQQFPRSIVWPKIGVEGNLNSPLKPALG